MCRPDTDAAGEEPAGKAGRERGCPTSLEAPPFSFVPLFENFSEYAILRALKIPVRQPFFAPSARMTGQAHGNTRFRRRAAVRRGRRLLAYKSLFTEGGRHFAGYCGQAHGNTRFRRRAAVRRGRRLLAYKSLFTEGGRHFAGYCGQAHGNTRFRRRAAVRRGRRLLAYKSLSMEEGIAERVRRAARGRFG